MKEVTMAFRKQLSTAATMLFALVLAATSTAAEKYDIDRSHSSVGFAVRHMVVTKVRGEFNEWSGTILYDDKDITRSSVEVSIRVASIDTKDAKRDEHLRSPDFFDVENHPTITFKSKRIEKKENGLVAVGDLTIRGVTKEIEIPFDFAGTVVDPYGNTRLGLSAKASVNRQDFGVSWSKKLDTGGLVVGDEVEIGIEVEAIKAK
jgi:polyisoprenoid-binding protein YceI